MSCDGPFATAADYADMWCLTLDSDEAEATVNNFLTIAASDIHAALYQAGMCDCTLAGWALEYLKKLNVVDALIYHQCPCGQPSVTNDMRKSYLAWITEQFSLIRQSKIELCAGHTGADFPAVGWAEQGTTEVARSNIIANDALRNS